MYNLGQNVSCTVFFTTLASSRSRFLPDWVLNINRIEPILQEPTSEVALHEVASAAVQVSTSTPTIIVPSQIPDIESVLVVNAK